MYLNTYKYSRSVTQFCMCQVVIFFVPYNVCSFGQTYGIVFISGKYAGQIANVIATLERDANTCSVFFLRGFIAGYSSNNTHTYYTVIRVAFLLVNCVPMICLFPRIIMCYSVKYQVNANDVTRKTFAIDADNLY